MKGSFVNRIIGARWLHHLLFWGASWYLLLRMFASSGEILPIDRIYTTVFLVPVSMCVYLNLLILIPQFLAKKKHVLYILLLVLSIAFFTWFNKILFDRLIDYILPGYYFISYYDYSDLLKFFMAFTFLTTLLKLSKGWFLLMDTRNKLALLEKEHAGAELENLKNQVNPHFLFNSLNTLYSLIYKKSDAAQQYILKLSEFLRYLLYETGAYRVKLEKEITSLTDYLDLQKLRSGENAAITCEIVGDPAEKMIAPLLFLPLVENSFKHGVKGETGPSFVDIHIHIGERELDFTIRNNIGYSDPVEKIHRTGIGLENLRRRLELLYPDRYRLSINEANEVFDVKLTVPLHHEA